VLIIEVEAKVESDTKKEYKISYKGNKVPFGATFVKGKDF
jgi:hypothetical protein